MMLGRLQQDCLYFLGNGNGREKHLWAGSVEEQISEMRKLLDRFSPADKPEWLTLEDIDKFEKEMTLLKLSIKLFDQPLEKAIKEFIDTKNSMYPNIKINSAEDLYNEMVAELYDDGSLYILKDEIFRIYNKIISKMHAAENELQILNRTGAINNLYFDDERVIFSHNGEEYKIFGYPEAMEFIEKKLYIKPTQEILVKREITSRLEMEKIFIDSVIKENLFLEANSLLEQDGGYTIAEAVNEALFTFRDSNEYSNAVALLSQKNNTSQNIDL